MQRAFAGQDLAFREGPILIYAEECAFSALFLIAALGLEALRKLDLSLIHEFKRVHGVVLDLAGLNFLERHDFGPDPVLFQDVA